MTLFKTRLVPFLALLILGMSCEAQTLITGTVSNKKGEALPGANVYINNTYDGVSTDIDGKFSFETSTTAEQELMISFLGYLPWSKKIQCKEEAMLLQVVLKENLQEMETVVITAGAFEASDKKQAVVLKPLDIVTTAGATADISGALNTLPGTQKVGEEGQLFVRGGDAHETKTFIDGMYVPNPYSSKVPDVPVRGRFSPFLFKGTFFSTGGYSAEYGQALSSALILETSDLAPTSATNIALMAVGASIGHTQRWEKASLGISADYTNLKPLFTLTNQQTNWVDYPNGAAGAMAYRLQTSKTGMLKVMGNYSYTELAFLDDNIDFPETQDAFGLGNHNAYSNATYKELLKNDISIFAGVSYGFNEDKLSLNDLEIQTKEKNTQARITLSKYLSNGFKLKAGAEWNYTDLVGAKSAGTNLFPFTYNRHAAAAFVESDIHIGTRFLARLGGRFEYDTRLEKINAAPRVSLAYKTGEYSQVSAAAGQFYQTPKSEYLSIKPNWLYERADHFMLNYQRTKNERTFRAEGYYKNYEQLISFNTDNYLPESYHNKGYGYASGLDVFFRDRKSIKNADFWISYSYLNTQRKYLDYSEKATPTFASTHNLSLVYKHYISKLKTQIGATYSLSSGRPYKNPNLIGWNESRTKAYQDLSLNASYITQIYGHQTIVFASVNNALGFNNEFGYRYKSFANAQGIFEGQAIRPTEKRFYFIGVFVGINH